jgi:hypothetical protein
MGCVASVWDEFTDSLIELQIVLNASNTAHFDTVPLYKNKIPKESLKTS